MKKLFLTAIIALGLVACSGSPGKESPADETPPANPGKDQPVNPSEP